MILSWMSVMGLLSIAVVSAREDAPEFVRGLIYHFQCPGQPEMSRAISIAVKYDGFQTTFNNVENAEWIGPLTHFPAEGHTWETLADFRHGMCLPASQGRKCGYVIRGTLKTIENDRVRGYGAEVLSPSVTQQCTASGHVAKACGSGKVESCRITGVLVH